MAASFVILMLRHGKGWERSTVVRISVDSALENVELPVVLRNLPSNASRLDQRSERDQSEEGKQENFFFSEQQVVHLAVPGIVLLCCGFLCPCFQAKKEAMDENDQGRQLNSNVSTGLEKVSAIPRVPPSPSRFALSPQLSRIGSVNLTLNQIIKATQNFSPSLKLVKGGFGTVYKGFLPNGQIVAFKRAKKEQVSTLRDEFSNEVELLDKIEHRNLVQHLGFCDKENECIIITEHVPNGTLRDHLDGKFGKILDLNQRLEIAIDVAHGLTYLHLYAKKTIIHRDVKSTNILLTESYRAKVSDFGFARTGPTDMDKTHISTKVKGTAGYLDPEYLRTYQLTPMSDVFSFGILLLEIISGRRPVELKRPADERITVRWVYKKYNEGKLTDILDPLLGEKIDDKVIGKLLNLAFHCAAPTRADRPDMKEVGEQLWEIRNEYGKSVKITLVS